MRRTIGRVVRLSGVGLHSGREVRVELRPADQGGVRFSRTDLAGAPFLVPEDWAQDAPPFRTVLRKGGAEVHTVEHLLSALAGLGVSDLEVRLDGPEVPGLDGSALPWAEALAGAGWRELPGMDLEPLAVRRAVEVREGQAVLRAEAYAGLRLSYLLDYPGEPLAQGRLELEVSPESYLREIAPARTFCLKREAAALLAAGLGKGANPRNTLLLDGDRVLETALRFPDEPVRHKIADLLGDLYLLGRPLRGFIRAERSGHRQNRALVRRLAEEARVEGEKG